MFFSHVARILAVLALVLGVFQIVSGYDLVASNVSSADSFLRRSDLSPGEWVDRGVYKVLFAIALGTLAEVSFAVRKASQQQIRPANKEQGA